MTKKQQRALDTFGRAMIERARDYTLDQLNDTIRGRMRSPDARALGKAVAAAKLTAKQTAVVRKLLEQAVDETMHNVLWFLEEENNMGQLKLTYKADPDAEPVDIMAASSGFSAELESEEGWRERFTKFEW